MTEAQNLRHDALVLSLELRREVPVKVEDVVKDAEAIYEFLRKPEPAKS